LSLRVYYLEVFTIVKAHGVPKIITPLVMAIETLSVSIRPLSLAVRLFSNILAGHILLHMVSDFYKNSLKNFNLIVGLLGLSGFFAVFTLEAGVSIIQPYVFFLLGCIYIFDLLLRSNLKFSRSNRFLKTLSI
jgi:F-type H+-transporting ATPase subunit a